MFQLQLPLEILFQEKDLSVYADTWFEIWRCRTHAAASETAAYTELLGEGSFAGMLGCFCAANALVFEDRM